MISSMSKPLAEKEDRLLDIEDLPEFVDDDADERGAIALTVPLVPPWKVRNFEQWKIRVIKYRPDHLKS